MPKLACLCGESINLSQVPNQQGFRLISEPALETLLEGLVLAHQQAPSAQDFEKHAFDLFNRKDLRILQLYECPRCGRLAVFADASDPVPALWLQIERSSTQEASSLGALIRTVDPA